MAVVQSDYFASLQKPTGPDDQDAQQQQRARDVVGTPSQSTPVSTLDVSDEEGSRVNVTTINFDEGSTIVVRRRLPHWEDPGLAWDRLVLGDIMVPGVWEIDSGGIECVLDKKKTKGKNGASIKDQGTEPTKLSCRGQFYSRQEWATMQEVVEYLRPRSATGKAGPLTISHPVASFLGVKVVVVKRIGVPKLNNNGIAEMQIELLEYVKPKAAGVTDKIKAAREKFESFKATLANKPLSGWSEATARTYYQLAAQANAGQPTEQDIATIEDARAAIALSEQQQLLGANIYYTRSYEPGGVLDPKYLEPAQTQPTVLYQTPAQLPNVYGNTPLFPVTP